MDANERLHKEWIGMAQPEGLVVTQATLKAAEANITWPVTELQAALRHLSGEGKIVLDLPAFFREILGWSQEFVISGRDIPDGLRVPIEGSEPLVPAYAVKSADQDHAFAFLVGQPGKLGADLDAASDDKRWTATPHQRFERLLRESGVHVGLLTNGRVFRLVYAPKGETAGWVSFRLSDMLTVDGRPLLGALHMLLNERRLLSLDLDKRLIGLLKASREYQNTVSNALREQVLSALRELLIGFQDADRLAQGAILADYRRDHLDEVYEGLVTVLMRSVFVLFAEEKALLPVDRPLYADSYSLTRLYAQLVEDRDRYGDTIDDRYGAWARIVSLFRLLHDGVRAADGLVLPARRGDFFDPDAFPFLEGRPKGIARHVGATLELPRVSDGVVFRVLDRLLVLGGERLQYKGLDVEQIGSVYEGLMGFEVEVAEGPSLCLTPEHVVVNLEALLRQPGDERLKSLKATAALDLKDRSARAVREASTLEALQAALARRNSSRQPGLIPAGAFYLQPGEERRKSGSHYTPKSLTAPIVETALGPVLERFGPGIMPEQILDLKICDPAMGSAAFLVEVCRQLADLLVAAWRRTNSMPGLPPDEDPVLHARRLIAQRCLYGVDRNPLAVDLARLSMWLVTFAKEHPFTFVDHALRVGDSLIGLSTEQIASLTLDVSSGRQIHAVRESVASAVKRAEELRRQIHSIGDPPNTERLVELWRDADEALHTVRMLGDLVVAAFFSASSEKTRKKAFEDLSNKATAWLATGQHNVELKGAVDALHEGEKPIVPFHWEIEFPEVFGRENPGFDCVVGNPPFAGKNLLQASNRDGFVKWLQAVFPEAHGSSDLVAYFFRRAYVSLRLGGAMGMLATNSVAQGDTRFTGLRWICVNGGTIYSARRRLRWPGTASVVVCSIHIAHGEKPDHVILDGRAVRQISAFLFPNESSENPSPLAANRGRSFVGAYVLGAGFSFDDSSLEDGASPLSLMQSLIGQDPRNAELIAPYMGGEQVNFSPTLDPGRYIIDFGERSKAEAKEWPDLFAIVEDKVQTSRRTVARKDRRETWWLYATRIPQARAYAASHGRLLVASQVSTHLAFAFCGPGIVLPHTLAIILTSSWAGFCMVQARVHEAWARFLGSSLEERPRYTPSDCFETFPFPGGYESNPLVDAAGKRYYEFRADLMLKNSEGLTDTYNRFHDPDERSSEIADLRELHARMDRAVLDAYGWNDIRPTYDFREQLDEKIRLTWEEDTRDQVLARLLELNRKIASSDAKGLSEVRPSTKAKKTRKRKPLLDAAVKLFPDDPDEGA
jgi:hypothetical protein